MYFTSKMLDKTWFVGIHNDYLYSIGEGTNGTLIVYRKCLFDAGEWIIFRELNIEAIQDICSRCGCLVSAVAGIIQSKLWIMASKYDSKRPRYFPQLYCIDLDTKNYIVFRDGGWTINQLFMEHLCIQCKILTFESFNANNLCFLIQLHHLDRRDPTEDSIYRFSKVFRIHVDEENMMFFFEEDLETDIKAPKNILTAQIQDGKFLFNLQRTIRDLQSVFMFNNPYTISLPAIGEFHTFSIKNFVEPFEEFHIRFFRSDQNGMIQSLVKERYDNDRWKYSLYEVNINFDFETVSFDFISSFYLDSNDAFFIQKRLSKRIFATPTMLLFHSKREILILINRILTLSESAYMALVKIPEPEAKDNNLTTSPVWMSMKYLYEKLKVPKNICVQHPNK